MAWDVLSGVAKMAWDVLSGVTKTAWDVLSGVAKNGMGCFVPGCFVLHSSMTCDMRHALNTMFCLLSVSFLIGELFCSHTHDRYANSMLYR